jgi:hypothetical protein
MSADLKVDIGPILAMRGIVDLGWQSPAGPVGEAFRAWGPIYRSAMRRRFMQLARGGAGWPPLKYATIVRRRHGKKGRYKRGAAAYKRAKASGGGQVSTLLDTGVLVATLDPVFSGPQAGQVQYSLTDGGLAVGIGGGAQKHKGSITVGALAEIHHRGLGHVPARPILVDPDDSTKNTMARALEIGIRKAKEQAKA